MSEAKPLLRDNLFANLGDKGAQPIDVCDKVLMLVGFEGAFRRSELVNLDVVDIEHVRHGLVAHLRFSKTDQDGKCRKIALPFGRTDWCPVNYITEWPQFASIADVPLFRPVTKSGEVMPERLWDEAVNHIIKKHVAKIDLNDAFIGR